MDGRQYPAWLRSQGPQAHHQREEAETVRTIFRLYVELGTVRKVKTEIDRLKLRTKFQTTSSGRTTGGLPFRVGHLYTILRNRLYRGEIHHKGQNYAGDHEPSSTPEQWDMAQAMLASNAATRRSANHARIPVCSPACCLTDRQPDDAVACRQERQALSVLHLQHLIAGANAGRATPGEGVRLAAHEIEGHIVRSLVTFLADAGTVITKLCVSHVPPAVANAAAQSAVLLSKGWEEGSPSKYHEAIRGVVSRVEVDTDAIKCAWTAWH